MSSLALMMRMKLELMHSSCICQLFFFTQSYTYRLLLLAGTNFSEFSGNQQKR